MGELYMANKKRKRPNGTSNQNNQNNKSKNNKKNNKNIIVNLKYINKSKLRDELNVKSNKYCGL